MAPELGFSLDTVERVYVSSPLNKRFEDFLKLAKQIEELAERAIGEGDKPRKNE